MKYSYSQALHPPGLLIPISLLALDREKGVSLSAEIDTGAGITSIPASAVKQLGLKPFSTVEARGAFDEYKNLHTYSVVIQLENDATFEVEAILNKRGITLLGRDVLNQLKILADGPNATFELD